MLMPPQCMTEIGTALRLGLHPYIFVVNNDGYDVERALHGPTAKYNDIQAYDHQLILPMMAGKNCKVGTPLLSHTARATYSVPFPPPPPSNPPIPHPSSPPMRGVLGLI